jgi:phosphoribosylformylglycinamidine synthase
MKTQRVYVEKRAGFDLEARRLRGDLADFLGARYPELARLRKLRILNRYDVSGLDEGQFEQAVRTIFSEPWCDDVFYGEAVPAETDGVSFAVEYLPGQYSQRADSAEQCAELSDGVRARKSGFLRSIDRKNQQFEQAQPLVRCAAVYVLVPGNAPVSAAALEAVKRYLINPVDSREARPELPETLAETETIPAEVPVLDGFITANDAELDAMARQYGLAMQLEDMRCCREWFASVKRNPTLAELRVLDTYWSDHCRHTTFNTILEEIETSGSPPALQNALALYEAARLEAYGPDSGRPRSLMDMALVGAKVLKKRGLAARVDESKEINACTVKVNAEFSGGASEPWLLLFKNETHNHPTEIEPFGGAATCLGGAIRDPLSGRAYAHQAMRISGGGDPRADLSETLPGKLPQIKIAREAAAGFASYGNQIGIATGQVAEFYHRGFLAKRMELGAVIAAVPAAWVRREEPAAGDLVILVGGRTGRDGIGGATGSSKMHSGESVESAGAEVQKGNAVEERKLQRLFRSPQAARLIKRCNDFGAGGVAVAVGELAPGLDIDLDKVPKKYASLDGIELAISESQERMAVVVAAADAEAFITAAAAENLEAVVIARVTAGDAEEEHAALRMKWRGKTIVDLSRKFLNTNGAPRSARVQLLSEQIKRGGAPPLPSARLWRSSGTPPSGGLPPPATPPAVSAHAAPKVLLDNLERELQSLRSCSRRGLQERFDGSIGAASVLFPWGGSEQGTPECGMAALLPSLDRQSRTASIMSFGYDGDLMEQNPYEGAKGNIREALAKFACLGGDPWTACLSLQEYFERPQNPESWGKPAAALLGALEAQLALGVPAIGGKDSMSGNYRDIAHTIDIAVPPTLVAFAAGTAPAPSVRSGALSGKAGNMVVLLAQASGGAERSEWDIFRANMDALSTLGAIGCVRSAYPVPAGGAAAGLALMAFGGNAGIEARGGCLSRAEETACQGSVLVEIDGAAFRENPAVGEILNRAAQWETAALTIEAPVFRIQAAESGGESAETPLAALRRAWESTLAKVYPQTSTGGADAETQAGAGGAALDDIFCLNQPQGNGSGQPPPALFNKANRSAAPLVVLPVFPGTNCEWDMERAFREAGGRTRLVIFRNRGREDIARSIQELAAAIAEGQILALSGGFSAGDEPDGSAKFIANVFRSAAVAGAVSELLERRDGLILGICNGFQALIKLGLVPYGTCRMADAAMPTLSFNRIGRHVSRMVRTRVMPHNSPWLALEEPGAIHTIPVSHGEGRLVIGREAAAALFRNGQVPFCYADAGGQPALREPDNPNGSDFAIEGLTSPDGRILGKMGHSERCGDYVHINIPGSKKQRIFEAGVRYFK